MNQSLEWRLARTFVRCYSLVLIISLAQVLFGPAFALFLTDNAGGLDVWTVRAAFISSMVVSLAVVAILWFGSNKIAGKLALSYDAPIEGEQFDFPFDVAVGLAGLIFLVEGLKGLAGEGAAWYFRRSHSFPPTGSMSAEDLRHLAISATEAVIGLVLFMGAKSIVQGITRLRGMPKSSEDEQI